MKPGGLNDDAPHSCHGRRGPGWRLGFTVVARAGPKASVVFMQAFGVIYLLIGVIGFLTTGFGGNGYLLGLVHLNTLDNFLHLGLGVVIGTAGWYLHARRTCNPSDDRSTHTGMDTGPAAGRGLRPLPQPCRPTGLRDEPRSERWRL